MTDSTPRIRWAGIVFGALFALVAAAGLIIALDADILVAVQEWVLPFGLSVTPSFVPFALIVAAGAAIVAIGAVALIRNSRKRRAREKVRVDAT